MHAREQSTQVRPSSYRPVKTQGVVRPATSTSSNGAVWRDDDTLLAVRPEVQRLLERSEGFARLAPDERRRLAQTMVKVSAARAQDDGAERAAKRASSDPGFAGEDFEAGAVRQGVEQFGELIQKVDFPAFVSGLIQNVFQAIVDATIEQMQAYGELLANVAKTVDQFARDNITENNARDYLAEKYPDFVGIETSTDTGFGFAEDGFDAFGDQASTEPQPRLVMRAEDASAALRQMSEELGLKEPVTDISEASQERRLVLAARLEIARSRQQLLASMVILGINRIVVTDGHIKAKVVFGMRARDLAGRRSQASLYDQKKSATQVNVSARYGGWFSPWSGRMSTSHSKEHLTTVQSSLDERSESQAEVKAQLSGDVRVNFKSDYLPMEQMATPQMIATPSSHVCSAASAVRPSPSTAQPTRRSPRSCFTWRRRCISGIRASTTARAATSTCAWRRGVSGPTCFREPGGWPDSQRATFFTPSTARSRSCARRPSSRP